MPRPVASPPHLARTHSRRARIALRRLPVFHSGFLAVVALASGAWAQPFTLTSITVSGGGGTALAPGWSLQCTIGQHDAGTVSAGSWTLALGYWPNTAPPQPPACVADVDDGSGTGTPDGGVTIDDLIYYLQLFELGHPRADIDDGSATGTPDGGVTIDDLLYFLQRFEAGC